MIFKFESSVENNRPLIKFDSKENRNIDWGKVGEILDGEPPAAAYEEIRITVSRPGATTWAFYPVAGTLGLISEEAVELIGRDAFRLYSLLSAKLNETTYYLLKCIEALPCLDRPKSELVMFPSDPNEIMEIKKFVFKETLIPDPLVFSIPELPGLFTTTTVRDKISENKLRGILLTELAN